MRLFSLHNPTKKSLERFRRVGRPRVNVLFLIPVFNRMKRLVPSDEEKESSSCNVGLHAANASNQLKDRHVQAPTGKVIAVFSCYFCTYEEQMSVEEFIILFIFYGDLIYDASFQSIHPTAWRAHVSRHMTAEPVTVRVRGS